MSTVRIQVAEEGVLGMTKPEVDQFLSSGTMIMRMATVDAKGDAVIHPVWYLYENDRIYMFTSKNRKLDNILRRGRVYFSIDTDAMPNKGVKGKGKASVVSEDHRRVSLGEKIVRKYMGDSQTEYAKALLNYAKGPKSNVIEIAPEYYTVWDYSKLM